MNSFYRRAGAEPDDVLQVGVLGPRGPCDDVTVARAKPGHAVLEDSPNQNSAPAKQSGQGRGHFTVAYRPVDRGNHAIVLMWGERMVYGSPFHVVVQ